VPSARFDHHRPPPREQRRGILYSALRVYTCFAEFFQETRVIDRHRAEPWLVCFRLARDLALLDLSGGWPTRAGASMALASGPRSRARLWSQRIYEDYPSCEGLIYPSSMDANEPAFALYERAMDSLPERPDFHRSLADPGLGDVILGAALLFNYRVELDRGREL
jgi:hypothetical protein